MWSDNFRSRDITWLSVILGVDAFIRGINYLTVRTLNLSPSLNTVREAFDMSVWGAVFTVGALVIMLGYFTVCKWMLAFGHALVGTLYLGLAAGIAATLLNESPFVDGIRSSATFVAVALIHVLLAWRVTDARIRDRNAR